AAPGGLGAAEGAAPRAAARRHQDVRVEVVLRRGEIVEVGDVLALGADRDRAVVLAPRGAGHAARALLAREPVDELEERDVALADAHGVDRGPAREDL